MKPNEIILTQIESALLNPNPRKQMIAIGTALSRIMENQTREEVLTESTRNSNGIGFTGAHGKIGTSMAKFFERNKFLTPKQVAYWTRPTGKNNRPRILTYRNQLLQFALKKAAGR
jgi:hypothetical protein